MVEQSEINKLILEAKAAAVSRIAETFTHPDDLYSKFAGIKRKIVAERALVENQLKSALDSQLEDASRGLELLGSSQVESQTVKSNMMNIQTLLNEAHHSIDNYAKIMLVNQEISAFMYRYPRRTRIS